MRREECSWGEAAFLQAENLWLQRWFQLGQEQELYLGTTALSQSTAGSSLTSPGSGTSKRSLDPSRSISHYKGSIAERIFICISTVIL